MTSNSASPDVRSSERILAIVLAGGKGSRMDVLTERRAKPTLPFGGVFSLLDICLSNLANSRVRDVWVVVQYQASSLDDVLSHGRPWDLDRNRGGLRVLPPQEGIGDDEEGMATGNADALFRIRKLVQQHDPTLVMVLSADHVYAIDHREVVRTHREAGAECTVVTTTMARAEAGNHTVVDVDRDGRVTRVHHKPDEPHTETVASEVFLYEPDVLVETLEELHRKLSPGAPDRDSGLGDFSEHLLPALVDRGQVVAHPLVGYWRDLGRPSAYFRAHQDLLAGEVDILHRRDWPICTASPVRAAARVHEGATVRDSMLGNGAEIHGRVERCVIGPDVVVEAGAVVHDAILMRGVTVRSDARVGWSIIDAEAKVGAGARVGSEEPLGVESRLMSDELTLIGMAAEVPDGAHLPAGARLDPGDSVATAVRSAGL
ncbi:glucose-1-phosphate adenylyltransferase family protein [Luteococcus sp. Sow4_B9]|uniref:glucose-1-phosphate adenylyltransferase family protein n=1 Tax=Luteococcus sp. Sow4_B9 TaxID=3438792 RepID=UPI003F9B9A62